MLMSASWSPFIKIPLTLQITHVKTNFDCTVIKHKMMPNLLVVGCWRGYLSGARCRIAYGPAADATAKHCLLLQ